ncbi:Gfo/Idh/MocA family oxidoreductase [Virgibacillus sp. NKC19-3]|uniref:Gfo/Idh/MocA family protein n=1 Tax=Virgibacillus saliphilus TaxID=2831674 RepID=UPI001C9AB1ED|nr:Gfo/Idh/MocA family oxidoreductase [Virgibacillus sp. NKC19-3]MBY7142830.1 Gfo/Idh/MocA family oxidoreductase [Virgibacillus sp. NKC19-3]
MRKLRIGIAGMNRGKHFYKDFSKVEGAEVVAVMDPDQQALEQFQHKYSGIYVFTEYEDLLDADIDAVVIASPLKFHAEQAILALNRDIHVLSEVTAATTIEDCRSLLRAVKESKAQYMMAENYCYIRENVAIRNMVEKGVFGEIYFAEGEYLHNVTSLHYDNNGQPTWRKKDMMNKRGLTYGTHSLGPTLNWFNERVKYVNCLGSGSHTVSEYKNDDTTIMLCRTENGALINIRLDMVSNRPHNMGYYSLQGTKGCYEAPRVPGEKHRVWLEDYAESSEQWMDLSDLYADFLPPELVNFPEEANDSHHWGADYFMVKDFVKCISENKPVKIDIYKALEYTLPGLLSEASIVADGIPVEVPDVRKW